MSSEDPIKTEIERGRDMLRQLMGEKADALTPWQIMCECAALEQYQRERAQYMICPILGF